MNNREVKVISVNSLRPDPSQPRKEFDEERLKAQGASYKEHGMINPIEVDEENMIVTGEMRWRSAKLVGIKKIPVVVLKDLTPDKRFARQACENMARTPLTGKEQIEAFRKIFTTSGKSRYSSMDKLISGVARKMGISQSWASQLYYLAFEAPKPLIELFEEGKMPITMFPELKRLKNKKLILRVGKKATNERMRVHDVRSLVNAINKHPRIINDLLEKIYVGSHDEIVAMINGVIREIKLRKVSEEEKLITTQAGFVQAFLNLTIKTIELVARMGKVNFGPGNLQVIQKAMADVVDTFNEFSIKKGRDFKRLKP